MTSMSAVWWIALIQFLVCGVLTGFVFFVPKIHHFPAEDRPYMVAVAALFGVLAIFGLYFMASA